MAEAFAPPSSLERALWRVVLVLLLIGATLTLWVLFGGTLGPTQARILASSFGVALYVAIALGNAGVLKRQPTSLGARLGSGVALVGAAVFVAGVWLDLFEDVWWWKVLGVSFLGGIACMHASALLLVRLSPRFHLVRALTRAAIYGGGALLCAMIVFEHGSDLAWRLVGTLWSLGAFGTAALPILGRLSDEG